MALPRRLPPPAGPQAKFRRRNNHAGGKAATVAGYAGPGFHNWPGSADVLVGEYETGDSHPKKIVRRDVRRRDRGQRPTASASVTSQSVSLWK